MYRSTKSFDISLSAYLDSVSIPMITAEQPTSPSADRQVVVGVVFHAS